MTDSWDCCKCGLRMSSCRWYSAVCRVCVKETRLFWVLAALLELALVFTLLVVRRRAESRLKDHS